MYAAHSRPPLRFYLMRSSADHAQTNLEAFDTAVEKTCSGDRVLSLAIVLSHCETRLNFNLR